MMPARLRGVALAAIRRIDHAVGRRASRASVLIDVRTPMNLAVLRPVWRHLSQDPRVRLAFVAEDHGGALATLAPEGLAGALIPRTGARWQRWDLAITADAWNHTPLARCRRRIQFFHGVAGKYDLDHPERLAAADLHQFDRVGFINTNRMQRYLRSGAVRPEQAVLVGYPKIDDLLNGAWPAPAVRSSLGLPPDHRAVLYAPTFSTAGSLHLAGEAIVQALLDTGASVIVKLHDRSMTPDPKHTNAVDWPARLAAFAAEPRFAFARTADAGPCLSAADVLVTDHSTVGFEFALLDRPLVIYDAPDLRDAARIDADKWALLRSMADIADTPDRLREAVRLALARPERYQAERRRARELFAFPGRATREALAAVYGLLELDAAPAAARASVPDDTPRASVSDRVKAS